MDSREPYDWVDDDSVDMSEVMQRITQLEAAPVVVTPPATTAGAGTVRTFRTGNTQCDQPKTPYGKLTFA